MKLQLPLNECSICPIKILIRNMACYSIYATLTQGGIRSYHPQPQFLTHNTLTSWPFPFLKVQTFLCNTGACKKNACYVPFLKGKLVLFPFFKGTIRALFCKHPQENSHWNTPQKQLKSKHPEERTTIIHTPPPVSSSFIGGKGQGLPFPLFAWKGQGKTRTCPFPFFFGKDRERQGLFRSLLAQEKHRERQGTCPFHLSNP